MVRQGQKVINVMITYLNLNGDQTRGFLPLYTPVIVINSPDNNYANDQLHCIYVATPKVGWVA